MWGKVEILRKIKSPSRITPTYVGKSLPLKWLCGSCRDHPHVCGEKEELTSGFDGGRGSPPRMWGKEVIAAMNCHNIRITPTYVGKSNNGRKNSPFFRDHPHVCGEKWLSWLFVRFVWGSPPRMWGKD